MNGVNKHNKTSFFYNSKRLYKKDFQYNPIFIIHAPLIASLYLQSDNHIYNKEYVYLRWCYQPRCVCSNVYHAT